MPVSHLLLALAVGFVWGTNFVVIKSALHELPPRSVVTVDASRTKHLDHDVVELLHDFYETARNKGIMYMNGVFLANNERMLKFVQGLGFQLSNDPEDNTVKLGVLPLQD